MPYARVGDLNMYYEIQGEGEPVVLLHGGLGVIRRHWGKLIPAFAEEFQVVAVEHRGHGRTDNPAQRFEDYGQLADDVAGLVETLRLGPVHLCGFSDGGIMALDTAIRQLMPLRSLILVGVNYYLDEPCLAEVDALEPEVVEAKQPRLARALEHDQAAIHGPEHWKTLVRQLIPMWRHYPAYTDADLARVDAPTLVAAGDRDPWGHLEMTSKLHRGIRGSELFIAPATSHFLQGERPELATLVFMDFWRRKRG